MRGAPLGPGSWVDTDGTAHHERREYRLLVEGAHELVQRYLAGTPVLETVVVSEHGATGVTDLVWEGELVRVVTPYTGAARLHVAGASPDDGRRLAALRHWWSRQPPASGPERELLLLSATLAQACGVVPGDGRPLEETDELGLYRRADGEVDLGAHAALAALAASS